MENDGLNLRILLIIQHFSVRSIKPFTYRLLHIILHSNFYVLLSINFYSSNDIKNILNLEEGTNVANYLKTHIEKDYNALGNLLSNNEHYIFFTQFSTSLQLSCKIKAKRLLMFAFEIHSKNNLKKH